MSPRGIVAQMCCGSFSSCWKQRFPCGFHLEYSKANGEMGDSEEEDFVLIELTGYETLLLPQMWTRSGANSSLYASRYTVCFTCMSPFTQ